MQIKLRLMAVSIGVLSLSACMLDGGNDFSSTGYNANPYQLPSNQTSLLYPEGYENTSSYNTYSTYNTSNDMDAIAPASENQVVVPDTYHVGAYRSPASPKDVDRSWVTSQNPQGYTIELANGEKASHVANVLYKAPKNERMAEVQSQRNGKPYYEGLYGSYPTQEAAQEALNKLPDDVKQNAGIKTWGSVQNTVE